MARRRRNRKPKPKATQENTTNKRSESLATEGEDFIWTNERALALLQCMIKRKPAGLHKHLSVLMIKIHLSERLKMNVPIKAIWSYLHSHWNMSKADEIEDYQDYQTRKSKKKYFELPQTEEWISLIKEQGALINANSTNTDEN